MLSRISRAVYSTQRACAAQHHWVSISAALPFHQQDPPSDEQSVEGEEPKAVLEARKREAARSYVARKIFGSAQTDEHGSSTPYSAVEQDRIASSQHGGNGSNESLGAATTSRASTQADSETSSSSSSPNTDPDLSGLTTAGSGGQGGGDLAVRNELAQLLKEHQVVVRGGQAEAVQLVDSLLAWQQGKWRPQESRAENK